ncbi:erythromycin esterase family protein [Chitinophaga sp. 22321]|uniref:Erythromycin esterase family protein n=1 Tax=Chitinophaga hostae TaxID=2831022 RepID=A0ABS5J6L1_9BACT|nr:erythromycin esterase family protein [Chitinophaga hostae]MBS0030858.1 erythromycin esterase family protein [Chitinophaga hostae]
MSNQPKAIIIRKSITTCLFLLANMITGYSQDTNTRWLNENAHVINADTATSTTDFNFLAAELKNNMVFGLGEASHGTKEFFNQKRRIIEYLIVNLDYKRLGFEFRESYIDPLNQYVINGTGDLKTLMKDMVLYNTEEIYDLFQFIKLYNSKQPPLKKVSVFGFDREEYASDPLNRDKFMAENIIAEQTSHQLKTMIWAHNVHIAKDTTMAQFKGMGYYLQQKFGENFYVLGFDTFKGSVTLITADGLTKQDFETEKGSFSEMFAKANHATIYIPFNLKPNPFSGVKNNITNIYANRTSVNALPIIPGADFDAILFIKTTSASSIIGTGK